MSLQNYGFHSSPFLMASVEGNAVRGQFFFAYCGYFSVSIILRIPIIIHFPLADVLQISQKIVSNTCSCTSSCYFFSSLKDKECQLTGIAPNLSIVCLHYHLAHKVQKTMLVSSELCFHSTFICKKNMQLINIYCIERKTQFCICK